MVIVTHEAHDSEVTTLWRYTNMLIISIIISIIISSSISVLVGTGKQKGLESLSENRE